MAKPDVGRGSLLRLSSTQFFQSRRGEKGSPGDGEEAENRRYQGKFQAAAPGKMRNEGLQPSSMAEPNPNNREQPHRYRKGQHARIAGSLSHCQKSVFWIGRHQNQGKSTAKHGKKKVVAGQ